MVFEAVVFFKRVVSPIKCWRICRLRKLQCNFASFAVAQCYFSWKTTTQGSHHLIIEGRGGFYRSMTVIPLIKYSNHDFCNIIVVIQRSEISFLWNSTLLFPRKSKKMFFSVKTKQVLTKFPWENLLAAVLQSHWWREIQKHFFRTLSLAWLTVDRILHG